jgi:hypothetical protein
MCAWLDREKKKKKNEYDHTQTGLHLKEKISIICDVSFTIQNKYYGFNGIRITEYVVSRDSGTLCIIKAPGISCVK